MTFEVEGLHEDRLLHLRYVFARRLEPSRDWALSDNARLGGVPIERWFDIVRAHDKNGNPRLDLFAFRPRDWDSVAALSIGQIVELEP